MSDGDDSTNDLSARAHALFEEQVREWPALRAGVEALGAVTTRVIELDHFSVRVQFNPGRLASSSAKVDAESIKQRKCFLCPQNLPPEQRGITFEREYPILANPFPRSRNKRRVSASS